MIRLIADHYLRIVPASETVAQKHWWLHLDFLDYEANETRLAWLLVEPCLRTPWQAFVAWLKGAAP